MGNITNSAEQCSDGDIYTGAKCDSAEKCVKVTTEKYCDDETAVHVGPVVNIGDNCVIDGDVKSSAVFNIKFYFKGTCNFSLSILDHIKDC